MKFHPLRPLGALVVCAILVAPSLASAQTAEGPGLLGPGYWRAALAPYSLHFRYSAEHKQVWAIGMERQRSDDWLAGASFFSNSFGQPSSYVYVGKRFPALFGEPRLFGQASAGVLYGYRGKYQHKVPLNYKGFSPGALIGLGWQFNSHWAATAHMLGDAGMMFQLSYDWR